MPGCRTHQLVGATTAGAFALKASADLPEAGQLVYCLAALMGGYAGGMAPDVLEPAVHSHHRNVFHSLSAGGGMVGGALTGLGGAGTALRAQAARLRLTRLSLPETDPRRTQLAIQEHLIYVLLGLAFGFAVGYASHVVADTMTPRGVPLACRVLV